MRPKFRGSRIVAAGSAMALFVGWALGVAADATFDFRVDRFEIEMTNHVALKGNFVEQFDSPYLTEWIKPYGTAFAADGFLHLASPGTKEAG